jgi:hypothetical protein
MTVRALSVPSVSEPQIVVIINSLYVTEVLVRMKPYNGYPVIRNGFLLGYVARMRLQELLS